MNDQPEALRVADELDDLALCSGPQAFWPLERVAARLLREQHAEIERLKAERNGFYMDYRVACDEKTKAQYDEIERLRWLLNGGGLCSKPLDADIAEILHANLDSLYITDEPPAAPDETEALRLKAENEALRRDAECYKRLKSRAEIYDGHVCFGDVRLPAPIPDRSPFDEIDEAVLAAALTAREVKP